MSSLPELRKFRGITPIDKHHAVFPQSELIPPLLKCSLDTNTQPGITRVQAGLLECFHLLRLQDEFVMMNTKGALPGSLVYGILARYADIFGLLSQDDLEKTTQPESKIYTRDRFEEAQKLVEIKHNEGAVIGMVHGAFDWAHLSHAYPFRFIYPYTDFTIAMCDPNWLIKRLKEVPGDPRPRVESIIWRMWQLAVLPTVDLVIEAPIGDTDKLTDFYPKMYELLHITRLGTNQDNVHLDQYKRNMERIGGRVIANKHPPFPFSKLLLPSSTARLNRVKRIDYSKNANLLPSSPMLQEVREQSKIYENRVNEYWDL